MVFVSREAYTGLRKLAPPLAAKADNPPNSILPIHPCRAAISNSAPITDANTDANRSRSAAPVYSIT